MSTSAAVAPVSVAPLLVVQLVRRLADSFSRLRGLSTEVGGSHFFIGLDLVIDNQSPNL